MSSSGDEPRPSYSQTRERLVQVVPPDLICSLTCGGRDCRYEGPEDWTVDQQAIRGLYSSWITDEILATSRPSTRLIQNYNITEQFHKFGIRSLINAQLPWEHGHCGDSLEPQSGFSYRPQDFMDSGISFYNFGLPDFGVVAVPRILDAVKVIAFALREGRVAVHCHAGLGRTGVLIACYLIYACRVSAADAIRFLRLRRPGSIQTGSQVSLVCDFALFLGSQWTVFPNAIPGCPAFTLSQYLVCQRHLLHGQEARSLRHIPKPVVVICRRLAQLAGGRRARGPWVELEREAAHKLLRQVIMRAASERHCKKAQSPVCESEDTEQDTRRKKRRGLLQSQVSCDTGILQLLLTSDTSVDMVNNGLCELNLVKTSGPEPSDPKIADIIQKNVQNNGPKIDSLAEPCQPVTPHHVLCIAEAMAELETPDTMVKQRVDDLQILVNEEGAWAEVSTESNPKILSILLWNWLQQLSSQGETLCCLLQCVSKLSSLSIALEELVLLRLLKALTKQPQDAPHVSPTVLLQLRSIVHEIRAHGVTSRLQRTAAESTQRRQLNAEKKEGKIS
ncbi:protein tyrosine phosphatase domain-containing protein 1-like isoform X2 [Hyla sarda]|uniref:protein tyrosine phosphatase domain-containing protein 1-like isoform X2 n=1 Tax=Hyla sarda TaxID=327740 RepID=UPI0024C30355|nr:protein tyrosine phosphatase domain-containing protein 1-like isoform X2 [Hyla sarda]